MLHTANLEDDDPPCGPDCLFSHDHITSPSEMIQNEIEEFNSIDEFDSPFDED